MTDDVSVFPSQLLTVEVLRRPFESTQALSIRYSQRLDDAGIEPSVGSCGDAYDNALAESVIGLYKTEVINRRGPWRHGEARELGITAARASQWRDRFLAAGQAGLKSRATEAVDDDHRRLQAKIGELLMETELLYAKVDQLEPAALWPAGGRRDEWRPVDLHPSGVWCAARLPRVGTAAVECICAAAGTAGLRARASPRARRRGPGRGPGGPHPPGA